MMIFTDFETQSAVDLKADGLGAYLRCSTTRIMSATFLTDGWLIVWVPPNRAPKSMIFDPVKLMPENWPGNPAPIKVWTGKSLPWEVTDAIQAGATLVGHNADLFDARVWELSFPWCPAKWIDTIHLCRAAGYPGGLDPVVKALGLEGKSDEGKRALKLLYKAKLTTLDGEQEVQYPVGTAPVWESMLRYNVRDVLMLERVYHEVAAYGEPDVIAINNTINRRGCPVDRQFASVVCDMWTKYQAIAADRVAEMTGGAIDSDGIRSPAKCKRWLESLGFNVASVRRQYLNELINDPAGEFGDTDDPAVAKIVEVLTTRQAATRATAVKAAKLLKVAGDDGRCRDVFVYHGAHTGRWSSRDLQLHNMARGVECDMAGILEAYHAGRLDLAAVESAANGARVDDVLATLMRPCIRAPKGKRLVVVDYSQVEARGVAWLAREQRMLDVFSDPTRDLYLDMASRLYGRECTKADKAERQVGKAIALGCGYGMGANKFGATCRAQGVDLAASNVTPDACVRAFRSGYPAVPICWRYLQEAAEHAVKSGVATASNGCTFRMAGAFLELVLPSGRMLRYRNVRFENRVPLWGGKPRPTLIYDGRHVPKNLYGGLLCENIVQALCRDLMAGAMCWLDPIAPIILHIHDEIVFEVDEDKADWSLYQCTKAMSELPMWAAGFPIRVSGFVTDHYVKSPLPGSASCEYMNGVQVP